MNVRQRRAQRYRTACMLESIEKRKDVVRARKANECAGRVGKAITMHTSLRERKEQDSTCLTKVAIYQAGYRRKQANVTARV